MKNEKGAVPIIATEWPTLEEKLGDNNGTVGGYYDILLLILQKLRDIEAKLNDIIKINS